MGAVPPPCAPTVPEHKQLWRHGRPHEHVTPGRVTSASAATTSSRASSATAVEAPSPLPATSATHAEGQVQWALGAIALAQVVVATRSSVGQGASAGARGCAGRR